MAKRGGEQARRILASDRAVPRRKRAANDVSQPLSDPMTRAVGRLEEMLAMGLNCNQIAKQWEINPVYVYNLAEMVEKGEVRWQQALVDGLYPDEGWQVELVAFCRGAARKAELPRYRIGNSRLYARVCPITGKQFLTPYHQQKFHPACTEAMKKRWKRAQKRIA